VDDIRAKIQGARAQLARIGVTPELTEVDRRILDLLEKRAQASARLELLRRWRPDLQTAWNMIRDYIRNLEDLLRTAGSWEARRYIRRLQRLRHDEREAKRVLDEITRDIRRLERQLADLDRWYESARQAGLLPEYRTLTGSYLAVRLKAEIREWEQELLPAARRRVYQLEQEIRRRGIDCARPRPPRFRRRAVTQSQRAHPLRGKPRETVPVVPSRAPVTRVRPTRRVSLAQRRRRGGYRRRPYRPRTFLR